MFQVKISEATAARRRVPILMVSSTDGFSPSTGVVTPTITISKNGATGASGAGTWTEIGNGQYYYELTATECDTLGWVAINVQKASSRQYNAIVQVMAYDAYAATNLGLTAIPAVATGSAGAIPTTGSGANQIAVNGSGAISSVVSVSGSVGSVTGNVGGSVASVVGNVGGSVGSVVGAVGSVTGNIGGNLVGSVGSLTATAVQNIWDDTTSSLTVVGSIGKLLVDNVNATISSRSTLTAANVWDQLETNITTASSIGLKIKTNLDTTVSSRSTLTANNVWSETLPGTYTSSQAGFKLNASGSAADPWSATIPGSYASGSAGFIVGNNLNATVSSRMATFTLPTNFSLLSISGTGGVTAGTVSDKTGYSLTQTFPANFSTLAIAAGTGAVTAGTVSDKTGYSLSTSQTFNTTGSVGSVTGSVASVTGNVGGNVVGSVNNVVGNVGGSVTGSVGSVTGSVGNVNDPSSIWNHLATNVATTGSIGLQLKTNVDATVSSRLASTSYTAAPTTTAIMQALWNQPRATSSPTGGIPAAGTYGFYIDKQLSTISGGTGGGGSVIVKTGPFKISSTELGPNNVLDLVKNDNRNIQLFVVDENDEKLPLNGSYTYSVKIYDLSNTLINTYATTLDYANGGLLSFDINTTVTATTGTYNVRLVENNGTTDTIYGGLRIEVRQ